MQEFTGNRLRDFAQANGMEIETRASAQAQAHLTPIWLVVDEGKVYIRSYRGAAGRWYREIMQFPFAVVHAGGKQLKVQAVPITDEMTIERVSQAFLQKYSTSSFAGPMVREEILGTTLRLDLVTE